MLLRPAPQPPGSNFQNPSAKVEVCFHPSPLCGETGFLPLKATGSLPCLLSLVEHPIFKRKPGLVGFDPFPAVCLDGGVGSADRTETLRGKQRCVQVSCGEALNNVLSQHGCLRIDWEKLPIVTIRDDARHSLLVAVGDEKTFRFGK